MSHDTLFKRAVLIGNPGHLQVPRKLRDLTKQLPSPRYESDIGTSRAGSQASGVPPWKGRVEADTRARQEKALPAIGEQSRNAEPESDAASNRAMPGGPAAAVRSGGVDGGPSAESDVRGRLGGEARVMGGGQANGHDRASAVAPGAPSSNSRLPADPTAAGARQSAVNPQNYKSPYGQYKPPGPVVKGPSSCTPHRRDATVRLCCCKRKADRHVSLRRARQLRARPAARRCRPRTTGARTRLR